MEIKFLLPAREFVEGMQIEEKFSNNDLGLLGRLLQAIFVEEGKGKSKSRECAGAEGAALFRRRIGEWGRIGESSSGAQGNAIELSRQIHLI